VVAGQRERVQGKGEWGSKLGRSLEKSYTKTQRSLKGRKKNEGLSRKAMTGSKPTIGKGKCVKKSRPEKTMEEWGPSRRGVKDEQGPWEE